MRCRWCLLRQHFELCFIDWLENDRMPDLCLIARCTDEEAQLAVCNARGAVYDLTKSSSDSGVGACAPTLSTEAWRKREAPRAKRSWETSRSVAGHGAAAGISTQTLSRVEDATAAGFSRYRCERLPGALSGVNACRSALLRILHAK